MLNLPKPFFARVINLVSCASVGGAMGVCLLASSASAQQSLSVDRTPSPTRMTQAEFQSRAPGACISDVGPRMQTQMADVKQLKGMRIPEGMVIQRPAERNAAPTIWFVHSVLGVSGNTGLSWFSAFATLTEALLSAQPGDEIWLDSLAVYEPSEFYILNGPGASRFDSFVVPSGVTIRGGFNSFESFASDRDLSSISVLNASGVSNYHVMQIFNAAGVVLDRLEIRGGLANGATINEQVGGGILALNSDITMIDCSIQSNRAQTGGGMYAQNCDLTLSSSLGFSVRVSFDLNAATDDLAAGFGFGGGLFMGFGGSLTLDPVTVDGYFFNNNIANVGGGIHLQQVTLNGGGSKLSVISNDTVLRGDGTGGVGAGMSLFIDPSVTSYTLPETEFNNNAAQFGGGIACGTDGVTPGSLNLSNSVFSSNVAFGSGGAISSGALVTLAVTDSIFGLNLADDNGGALFVEGSLAVTGSSFNQNRTLINTGGAIIGNPTSSVSIEGCDFTDNTTGFFGGDAIVLEGAGPNSIKRSTITGTGLPGGGGSLLLVRNSASAQLQNLVLTGHFSGPMIIAESNTSISGSFLTISGNTQAMRGSPGAVLNIFNSVIHNNGNPGSAINPNGGTINISDSVVEGGYAGTNIIDADPLLDASLRLSQNSPAIDAGNGVLAFGIPTDRDGNARERDDTEQPDTGVPGFTGFVPDMGAFEFQGTSEQLLVEVPLEAPTVQDGMNLVRNGGTVQLSQGFYIECLDTNGKHMTIQSIDPFDPAVVTNTKIRCDIGTAITVSGGSQVTLDGVSLESLDSGSGLRVDDGTASVFRSIMVGRNAGGIGGAAYVALAASADFTDSALINSSARLGGGLAVLGTATVTGCDIGFNAVSVGPGIQGGGVIIGGSGSVVIDRTEIHHNSAVFDAPNNIFSEGGGVYLSPGGSSLIRNSTIHHNTSWGGGGFFSFDGLADFINVTVSDNDAGSDAGGLKLFGPNMISSIRNSIVTGNTDPNPGGDDDLQQFSGAVISVEYSNFGSVNFGGTNISVDPMFVNPSGDDYRLSGGSPSIDAGSNTAAAGLVLDLDLNSRFADDTGTPDTGEGTLPVIDMGAYEFQGTTVSCAADLNGDGVLDNGDIGAFIGLFLSGDLAADMNGDGVLDNGDIGTFIALFLAGC